MIEVKLSDHLKLRFSDAEVEQYMKDSGLDKLNSSIFTKEDLFKGSIRLEVEKMLKEQILNKKAYQRNEKIEKILS